MINIIYEVENQRTAAYDGRKIIGECTYSPSDNLWIADHTFVEKEYNGQGIARKLLAELVKQARLANVKIVPLCPFVKREFELKGEYGDIKG